MHRGVLRGVTKKERFSQPGRSTPFCFAIKARAIRFSQKSRFFKASMRKNPPLSFAGSQRVFRHHEVSSMLLCLVQGCIYPSKNILCRIARKMPAGDADTGSHMLLFVEC